MVLAISAQLTESGQYLKEELGCLAFDWHMTYEICKT